MPRSNWKGVISFGLVTIPIVLYPSQNKKATISFHQIDKRDNARIQYQRVNSNTGKVVPWEQITRGYEYDKDTTIPVPEDVLKKVAGDKAREINIDSFIDKKDLDLLTIDNVYYLVPDKNGTKGYVILRESLTETNKVGIAKVIISTKEYLTAVMPHEGALVLCLLKYDDEVRKLSEFDLPDKDIKKYKVTSKEVDMAKQLIKSMTAKWRPEKYEDDYQQSIHEWVEESVNNLPHRAKEKAAKKIPHNVNFVDLLKKSLSGSKVKAKSKAKVKSKKAAAAKQPKIVKHKAKYPSHNRVIH